MKHTADSSKEASPLKITKKEWKVVEMADSLKKKLHQLLEQKSLTEKEKEELKKVAIRYKGFVKKEKTTLERCYGFLPKKKDEEIPFEENILEEAGQWYELANKKAQAE